MKADPSSGSALPKEYEAFKALLRQVVKPEPKPAPAVRPGKG
jgi:hypothetical protein